jgi:uncharacterized protein (TIGR03435 family)
MRNLLPTLVALSVFAQPTPPAFEAASIHILEPPFQRLYMKTISGTRVRLEGYAITNLVSDAFGVKRYQVDTKAVSETSGGVFYDIDARAATSPTPAEFQAMLQTLLVERFHLAIHHETRSLPIYALVVDKNGPALTSATEDDTPDCATLFGPVQPTDRNYRYRYTNCPTTKLAETLPADRPVIIDKTGLTGRYNISIFITPEFRMQNGSEPGDIRFLDAVRKLGLRLEPQNAPFDTIVIDHIDNAPTPN